MFTHTPCLFALACLGENYDHRKKKGDPAAIAEDKKKKKKKKGAKKGKGKMEEGEEGRGDGGSEGEKAAKKKNEKKVKKKKKSKVPVQKTDGGLTSDEGVQPQVPLPRHKTELWALGLKQLGQKKKKLSVQKVCGVFTIFNSHPMSDSHWVFLIGACYRVCVSLTLSIHDIDRVTVTWPSFNIGLFDETAGTRFSLSSFYFYFFSGFIFKKR